MAVENNGACEFFDTYALYSSFEVYMKNEDEMHLYLYVINPQYLMFFGTQLNKMHINEEMKIYYISFPIMRCKILIISDCQGLFLNMSQNFSGIAIFFHLLLTY